MIDRATFGDFARATVQHLSTSQSGRPSGRMTRAEVIAETIEYSQGLRRVLRVMTRYLADIPPGSNVAGDPWAGAAVESRNAAENAYGSLPSAETRAQSRITGKTGRDLSAAAAAMTAGRDLLHTHFMSTPDGDREARSEWAPLIMSEAVNRALLVELTGWAKLVLARGDHLTSARMRRQSDLMPQQQSVIAASTWLAAMVSAVTRATAERPVPEQDLRQLHAIPANVLQPRRLPAPAETVPALCQGITGSAERVRRAATVDVPDATLSQFITAESFSNAAACATVISHNCEILPRSLAARALELGATRLSRRLLISAQASGAARVAWLDSARSWLHIKTDADSAVAPAAIEAADLALWTGRLAYADPAWNPSLGPAHETRLPEELAAGPVDFHTVMTAVHQASLTVTTLAAADYTQIRAAGQVGRLLVPVVRPGEHGDSHGFMRAPPAQISTLLTAYRSAGTTSVKATAKAAELVSDLDIRNQDRIGWPTTRRPPTRQGRRVGDTSQAETGHEAGQATEEMPGPIERLLRELGVTGQELIDHAAALDAATTKLVNEAVQETAPQRWNAAVRKLEASWDTDQLIREVLARDDSEWAPAIPPPVQAEPDPAPQPEPESPEAEP